MIALLEGLAGPGSVSERVVADLWPLTLIRNRSGVPMDTVLSVRPETYEQVQAVIRWAAATGTVLVVTGGLSGVCGAVHLGSGEIALDLTGLDRILEVDEADLTCRVQAGVVAATLEAELDVRGLTLGHFPSSLPVATMGGLVSTRSSGQMSGYYGNIEDLILGLTVVLPDGSLLESRPTSRSATGPALHTLFTGAEGAIGAVVEATLRISRRPEVVSGQGLCFPDLGSGLRAMKELLQSGLRPLVLRLYDPDDTAFQGLDLGGGCLMVLAAAGPAPLVRATLEVAGGICATATDLGPGPWERWLEHRYALSADRLKDVLAAPGMVADTIELGAPWSEMESLHREVREVLAAEDRLALCHFSHASAQGCCAYFTVAGYAGGEEAASATYRRIWAGAMEVALRHHASLSHHHGAGQLRGPWVGSELGGWLGLWDRIRAGLDPQHLMNPHAVGGASR